MQFVRQSIFAVITLLLAWVTMTTTHELGHVIGALLTGGTYLRSPADALDHLLHSGRSESASRYGRLEWPPDWLSYSSGRCRCEIQQQHRNEAAPAVACRILPDRQWSIHRIRLLRGHRRLPRHVSDRDQPDHHASVRNRSHPVRHADLAQTGKSAAAAAPTAADHHSPDRRCGRQPCAGRHAAVPADDGLSPLRRTLQSG
jgi:hypothetical protein